MDKSLARLMNFTFLLALFHIFLLQREARISLLKATKLQPQRVQSINVIEPTQLASVLLITEGPERMEPPQIPNNWS